MEFAPVALLIFTFFFAFPLWTPSRWKRIRFFFPPRSSLLFRRFFAPLEEGLGGGRPVYEAPSSGVVFFPLRPPIFRVRTPPVFSRPS